MSPNKPPHKRICKDSSTDSEGDVRTGERSEEDTVKERLDLTMNKLDKMCSVLDTLVIGMSELTESVNDMKGKVEKHDKLLSGLSDRIERNENAVRGVYQKVERSAEEVRGLMAEVQRCSEKMRALEDRAIDQEARSRRNNLIFHGIPESEKGVREDTLSVIQKFMADEAKVSHSKDLLIQRVHRMGQPKGGSVIGSKALKPRPIIASFVDFRQRQHVRECRHNVSKQYSISEDLPKEVRRARKELGPQLEELKKQGKKVAISYPAKLFADRKFIKEVKPIDCADPYDED